MTTQFQPTPQHMVQDVKNIIEGYRMGALRALAQDPVQNSLDARIGSNVVKVEYQLHIRDSRRGAPVYLLTVTDTGTSGLSGEIMTLDELQRLRYRLNESQRWAAFEAHGFTKTGDHNIGSRGQGKSAFLYQSKVPPPAGDPEEERMLMLYDTLLPDGEYRLGVRFASPADVVRNPLIGRSAREAISSDFFKIDETIDTELEVPMGFEPLKDVGTRVIVPFISGETVKAISEGTLSKWIERCWWRPIQKGELEVSIRFPNGRIDEIGMPEWWEGEPWSDMKQNGVAEYRDLQIGENNGYEIERLVLLHRDDLEEPEELHSTIPEYSGIQLLRHGQWVETLGAKAEFPDIVPFAHRGQFRGFAEFNDALNRRLRSIEKPQHDSFDGRYLEVKQIRSRIDERVRDFARRQGWPITDETVQDAADIPDTDLMSNIIASFISPVRESLNLPSDDSGTNSTDDAPPTWELDFSLHYPEGGPRVDWGQQITGIIAKCSHQPKNLELSMNVRLQIKSETGRFRTLQQKFATSSRGEATLLFDDLEIVPSKGGGSEEFFDCGVPDAW